MNNLCLSWGQRGGSRRITLSPVLPVDGPPLRPRRRVGPHRTGPGGGAGGPAPLSRRLARAADLHEGCQREEGAHQPVAGAPQALRPAPGRRLHDPAARTGRGAGAPGGRSGRRIHPGPSLPFPPLPGRPSVVRALLAGARCGGGKGRSADPAQVLFFADVARCRYSHAHFTDAETESQGVWATRPARTARRWAPEGLLEPREVQLQCQFSLRLPNSYFFKKIKGERGRKKETEK